MLIKDCMAFFCDGESLFFNQKFRQKSIDLRPPSRKQFPHNISLTLGYDEKVYLAYGT